VCVGCYVTHTLQVVDWRVDCAWHLKTIGRKTAAALGAGVKVIACVGEKLEEREANKTMEVVVEQMQAFTGMHEGGQ
jgi:triosephosphate isomerase